MSLTPTNPLTVVESHTHMGTLTNKLGVLTYMDEALKNILSDLQKNSDKLQKALLVITGDTRSETTPILDSKCICEDWGQKVNRYPYTHKAWSFVCPEHGPITVDGRTTATQRYLESPPNQLRPRRKINRGPHMMPNRGRPSAG